MSPSSVLSSIRICNIMIFVCISPMVRAQVSNYSFQYPPKSNTLTSSSQHQYSFQYLGPFNTTAYPGEPGITGLLPPVITIETDGTNTTIPYDSSLWTPSNWVGTVGPDHLENIAYIDGEVSFSNIPGATSSSYIASCPECVFVYKVKGPVSISGKNKYGIVVEVATGEGYIGVMECSVAVLPGNGNIYGSDAGLPSYIFLAVPPGNEKSFASSETLAPSSIPTFSQVSMVNGVGYLYIVATTDLSASLSYDFSIPGSQIANASGKSDFETVIESVSDP